MKKRFKKSLITIFSCIAICCSGALATNLNTAHAAALTKNASEIITVSDGLTVAYNVSGSEKSSYLSKDTKKGIHFSSKQNGKNAENNYVAFNNTLSGLFELDFRVYTQNKANVKCDGKSWYESNDAEEIREVAITLTDTDADESFTIYIKGGSPWAEHKPNARVAYGDVGENYGSGLRYGYSGDGVDYPDSTGLINGGTLGSKDYNTQISGTSFTNNFLHSTVVGFDPITKEVYEYNFQGGADNYDALLNRRVILDLDNLEHLNYAGTDAVNLLDCKFNNYKVKFTVVDVTEADEVGSQGKDEPANFILYSLNGQSLGGADGVITADTAPGLSANCATGMVNVAYQVPTPSLKSVLGETPAFKGYVKVVGPDGKNALSFTSFSEGLTFTPTKTGVYTIIYSSVKGSSNSNRKAMTASGTYTGNEVTYSYPVTIEKEKEVAAVASDIITLNGLSATYNVSARDIKSELVNDENKGIKFSAVENGSGAVGASVAFKNTLSGEMELNFRVYTQQADTCTDYYLGDAWHTRNNAEEIRELAITVTDKDSGESFTIYIKGGTDWNVDSPNARVAYGDVGENYGSGRWYDSNSSGLSYYPKNNGGKGLKSTGYNTELVGTTFTNRARNNSSSGSGFIGGGYSTNVGFDPVSKVVYAYTYGANNVLTKRPILDLNDAEDMQYLTMNSTGGNVNATLPSSFVNSTFKNYTVKMTITEMTEDMPANFVVYHLNGQSLGGEDGKLVSSSGYGLYLPELDDGFVNMSKSFPKPYASSVLKGAKEFNGTIKITDENGNVVVSERAYDPNYTYTPETDGVYTISYGGMKDENDCLRLKYDFGSYKEEEQRLERKLVVKHAIELPSYDFVMKKMGVDIGAKVLGSGMTIDLEIVKDGVGYDTCQNIPLNFTYAFNDNGEYDLIYTVKSANGSKEYETSLTVIGMQIFMLNSQNLADIGKDFIIDKTDFSVYYCEQGKCTDYTLSAEVYNGSTWVNIDSSNGSINLKDTFVSLGKGEWTVRFTVEKQGDSSSVEKTYTVVDVTAPSITVDTGDLENSLVAVPEKDQDGLKYFVTLMGNEIVIPSVTVQDVGNASVQIFLKKPTDEVSVSVMAGDVLCFDQEGVYSIVYKAQDDDGNVATFVCVVEIKEIWLTVTAEEKTLELGENFVPNIPLVINSFTKETITNFDYSVKLFIGSEEVEKTGETFKITRTGVYDVVYTVVYGQTTQEFITSLTVKDTVKPTITINGEYVKTAKIGDTISILKATATDKSACDVKTVVIFNDNTKLTLKNKNELVIDKAGKYVIRYTATDLLGNATSVEFTITVLEEKKDEASLGCASCSGSMGGSSFALMGLACSFIVLKIKRKKEN